MQKQTKNTMNRTIKTIGLLIGIGFVTFLSSCKKDEPISDNSRELSIQLKHVWGMNMIDFTMSKWYIHPQSNDSLHINKFAYFLSDITLIDEDNNSWKPTTSIYLINGLSPESQQIKLRNVPNKKFIKIKFNIGLTVEDQLAIEKIALLDYSEQMTWSSSNYFHILTAGLSPHAPDGIFEYHIGGVDALQVKELDFPSNPIDLKSKSSGSITINVNAARFWHGAVKTADVYNISAPAAIGAQMALNFANGIIVSEIK